MLYSSNRTRTESTHAGIPSSGIPIPRRPGIRPRNWGPSAKPSDPRAVAGFGGIEPGENAL